MSCARDEMALDRICNTNLGLRITMAGFILLLQPVPPWLLPHANDEMGLADGDFRIHHFNPIHHVYGEDLNVGELENSQDGLRTQLRR